MYQPLADKIRPTELSDMVGQEHILGENGLLRRLIESGNIPNMIFYGPSGVGKTTLAQIIAGNDQPAAVQAQRDNRINCRHPQHCRRARHPACPAGRAAVSGRNPVFQ